MPGGLVRSTGSSFLLALHTRPHALGSLAARALVRRESERTARDSQRDSLRDSLRGTSPIRGASPIRGSMQSSAPPPPASYVPSSANYGNELPRSGSFSANGQRGYSPKRSVSNGNGMANGSSPLTYKQQDTVAAIIHMLDDSNMTGTEKAQVLAAVSSRIGMR